MNSEAKAGRYMALAERCVGKAKYRNGTAKQGVASAERSMVVALCCSDMQSIGIEKLSNGNDKHGMAEVS